MFCTHRLIFAVLGALGDAPSQLGHVLAHLYVFNLQLLDININIRERLLNKR